MNSIGGTSTSYDLSRLPAVPHVLVELLNLCHLDDTGFEQFSELISTDTALTARVLNIANSPAFRQWKDITDLRRILIVLGMRNLKTIVTTCAVEQFFQQFSPVFNHQVGRIWIRSIKCANLCERLACLLGYPKPGEAFLAGMLHQTGMLILMSQEGDKYLQLLDSYDNAPHNFCQFEKQQFQVDHCELGATLTQSWKLDSFLADAIHFQRSSTAELRNAPILLKILAVAARFDSEQDLPENPMPFTRSAELLGLTAETTTQCLHDAGQKSAAMLSALGISTNPALIAGQEPSDALPDNETTTAQLREAVRRIALTQVAAPNNNEDLLAFAKQVRISFCSVFPLLQVLLLRFDSRTSQLIPVNDLGYHQLDELIWNEGDDKSRIVAALNNSAEETLTSSQGSIADQQLLRLLGSPAAVLLPLYHQKSKLGLIALGFDQEKSPLSTHDKSLMSLFSVEIARRLAILNKTLEKPSGIGANELRQLAHEISNPLSIINNYLYVLGKKLNQEDTAQEELRTISEEIERIGRILLHAKGSHSAVGSRERTDINELIRELDRILTNSLYAGGRIQSTLVLDDSLQPLRSNADKLKQILINLLKNAAEAIEDKGTIHIGTRDNIYQEQQCFVEITIKDSGSGIAPTVLQKLFSPVDSTKEGHSGLGLVVVNNLVKELGGSISCFSSSTGTEFKILLPRTTA